MPTTYKERMQTEVLEFLKKRYGYVPETVIPVTDLEEQLLWELLRGDDFYPKIGQYDVLFDKGSRETTMLVYSPGISIKYIHAQDPQGHLFYAAMPQEWCEYHFGIKGRIEFALGTEIEPEQVAGGYLTIDRGSVECRGRSMDFGEGNHILSQWHFQKLLNGTKD